jgi:LysM repeat protein
MDDRWKPLSRTGGTVVPFAKTLTPQQLLAAAPPEPSSLRRHADGGSAHAAGTSSAPGFISHQVSKSDTLLGLAFKYGVTVSEIRLANDLPSENLATTPTLRIPVSGTTRAPVGAAESRAAQVRKFRVLQGVSEAEASYYIDEANGDYAAAELQLRRDLAFEKSSDAAALCVSQEAAAVDQHRKVCSERVAAAESAAEDSSLLASVHDEVSCGLKTGNWRMCS